MDKHSKICIIGSLILFSVSPSFVLGEKSSGITFGHSLGDIAVNYDTNTIFISTMGSGQGFEGVFVIDGQTNEVIEQIEMENKNLRSVAVNPFTNQMYVGYTQTQLKAGADPNHRPISEVMERIQAVDVIDRSTNQIIKTINTKDAPNDIAINTNTNMIFVANVWTDVLSVIDGNTNSIIKEIKLGIFPGAISVNHNTNTVYVAIDSGGSSPADDRIFVIDGDSLEIEDVIRIGNRHPGIDVNPVTNLVYVSNFGSALEKGNSVSVIDGNTNKIIDEIKVGEKPTLVTVNPNNNSIYVLNFGSQSVSVIDGYSNEIITNVDIGEIHHDGLAVNPNTGFVYVIQGKDVKVIDGETNELMLIETKEKELSLFEMVLLILYFDIKELFGIGIFFAIPLFLYYIIRKKRKTNKI